MLLNQVAQIEWCSQPAWVLEDVAVRVVIVPALGGKIVSLYDKHHGYEWLIAPQRPYRTLTYASVFVDQDMSGWDEMFPTINACRYPAPGAFSGVLLPDHGEVWCSPWQVEEAGGSAVVMRVDGVALPYRLRRRTALLSPGGLTLEYQLENIGAASFAYLWAAHPQFAVDADTTIVLPESAAQVINVLPSTAWGDAGERYPWPDARSKDGRSWELERIRSAEHHECRKFYLPPETPLSWAGLVNHRQGCSLRMEWSSDDLPYLGIWVDEGAYNPLPTVALEPSNGYYDSLLTAIHNRRVLRLAPGAQHRWSLQVRLQK